MLTERTVQHLEIEIEDNTFTILDTTTYRIVGSGKFVEFEGSDLSDADLHQATVQIAEFTANDIINKEQ